MRHGNNSVLTITWGKWPSPIQSNYTSPSPLSAQPSRVCPCTTPFRYLDCQNNFPQWIAAKAFFPITNLNEGLSRWEREIASNERILFAENLLHLFASHIFLSRGLRREESWTSTVELDTRREENAIWKKGVWRKNKIFFNQKSSENYGSLYFRQMITPFVHFNVIFVDTIWLAF